ncbi:sugar phosphate nucleotidyltransferase [Escherichia coli]|nr:sugar phosphate nucleotidyltransferase [Escherichia coli]
MPYAEAGKLVTFGIVRIYQKPVMAIFVAVKCLRVSRIRWPSKWRSLSKTESETAQAYVASGEYYWNSGMFLFRAGRYLEELKNISGYSRRP